VKRVGTKSHVLYDSIFYGKSVEAESILAVAREQGKEAKVSKCSWV